MYFPNSSLYCPNSTKHQIPQFLHSNMNWNWVPPFDSNNKFHAQTIDRNGIGGHLLSILILVFYSNPISMPDSVHPNIFYLLDFCDLGSNIIYILLV